MPREIQNSDGFNPYVWIEMRMNNRSHVMQEGICGFSLFGVHIDQVQRYSLCNKATPVSCRVQFSPIKPGSTTERGKLTKS